MSEEKDTIVEPTDTPTDAPTTPNDEMAAFVDSIVDTSHKNAFKETLNEDGTFNKERVRDLAGRMIANRRSLSKIQDMPENITDFKEKYTPDDKYKELFNEENKGGEKVRSMFDNLDKMCQENTIGITKNKAIKDFLLDTLATNGIIDVATPEEKQAKEQERLDNQKAVLQDALGASADLDKFNQALTDFIEDESDGDEDAKLALNAICTSAKGKLILYSLRNRIYGKPVPVMKTEIGESKKSLLAEYNKADTPLERRKEIAEKLNEIEGIK